MVGGEETWAGGGVFVGDLEARVRRDGAGGRWRAPGGGRIRERGRGAHGVQGTGGWAAVRRGGGDCACYSHVIQRIYDSRATSDAGAR